MTDEEMAKEYVDKLYAEKVSKEDYDKDGRILYRSEDISDAYLAGLEAGRPKWHKVADGDLPKVSSRYWVYTGGEPFTLDFDTEVNAFGYWCLDVGENLGVRDSIFETVAERDEDEVIAWKEIVLPKEIAE